MAFIYYYPNLTATENYSLTGQSKFVAAMHSLNLTVLPFALADDKIIYGSNDSIQTKSIVLQGIDGVFTDYISGTLRAFSLIGS
jgi:hypothetical protein